MLGRPSSRPLVSHHGRCYSATNKGQSARMSQLGNPLHGNQLRASANDTMGKSPPDVTAGDREHGCDARIQNRDQSGKLSCQKAGHKNSPGFLAVQAGESSGKRPRVSDSLTTPIVQTAAYTFSSTEQIFDYLEGRYQSFKYGRDGNPTVRVLEEKIKDLERAEDCLVTSSGMNAISTMMLSLVPPGGHVVMAIDCCRETREFCDTFMANMGVKVSIIDPSNSSVLEEVLKQKDVSMFFSESPTNTYLRCIDIPRIKSLCKEALVVIDSTYATPINQRAISLGADLVIHSATKYLSGHQDVLAGAIAGRADLIDGIRKMRHVIGGTLDAHASYLVLRGMKTLDVRLKRQNETGLEIARRLCKHTRIVKVYYPGLEDHPDHAVAKKDMSGFGGVVSFEVDGDLWESAAVVDGMQMARISSSLGGVESLIQQPVIMNYWDLCPERRKAMGIKDNLIRLSCGVEQVEDIWADIERALNAI